MTWFTTNLAASLALASALASPQVNPLKPGGASVLAGVNEKITVMQGNKPVANAIVTIKPAAGAPAPPKPTQKTGADGTVTVPLMVGQYTFSARHGKAHGSVTTTANPNGVTVVITGK